MGSPNCKSCRYLQYDPEALRDHTAAVLDAGMSTIEHLELKKSELVEQLTKAFDATAEAVSVLTIFASFENYLME